MGKDAMRRLITLPFEADSWEFTDAGKTKPFDLSTYNKSVGAKHAQQQSEETSQKAPVQAAEKSTESRHFDEATGGKREPSPKA